MEEQSKLSQLTGHLKEYAAEQYNLVTINIYEKASKAISGLVSVLVLWVLATFAILFVSMGLAWWIGQQLKNPFLGFLIVGGFYVVVTVVLMANKDRWIRLPVINSFLRNITDEKD